jgi:hypothetical protein
MNKIKNKNVREKVGIGASMKTILIAVLFVIPTFAQQHAPTIDVCRADAAAWTANSSVEAKAVTAKLSFSELGLRRDEMSTCEKVDPYQFGDDASFQRYMRYVVLKGFYAEAGEIRAEAFIARHQLASQFLEEDEAGAR